MNAILRIPGGLSAALLGLLLLLSGCSVPPTDSSGGAPLDSLRPTVTLLDDPALFFGEGARFQFSGTADLGMVCTPRGGLYFTEGVAVVQGDIDVRGPLTQVDGPLPGSGAFEKRTVVLRAESTQAASVWAWAACYNETRGEFMEANYDVVNLQVADGQASMDYPAAPMITPVPPEWSHDRLLFVIDDEPESRLLLELFNPLGHPVEVRVATKIATNGGSATWNTENVTLPARQALQVPVEVPGDASTVEIQSSWAAHPREFLQSGPEVIHLAMTAKGWEQVAVEPGDGPGSE